MSTSYGSNPTPPPPQTVYVAAVPPKPGFFARLLSFVQMAFFLLFLVAILAAVFGNNALVEDSEHRVDEKYYSHAKDGSFKVVILDVSGVISSGDSIRRQCEKIAADESVKAVVLRVDSPGGTISASDAIYHYLRKLVEGEGGGEPKRKLPMVVSMGGLAASGGYYVSMACGDTPNVVYAEPTTWTGSIGVIIPHYNIAGLMEKLEIEEDAVKSAPLKSMGDISRKMTPEERKVFEKLVEEAYDRFKAIVESGRPKLRGNKAAIDKVATGQIFTTKQALELGMVDKEGFLEDAVDRAIELAKLDPKTTKVVRYKKHDALLDAILGAKSAQSNFDLRTLLEGATPRAYYLFAAPGAANESGSVSE